MVFMLFSVMKETILFYSGRCRIILDWSRASDQLLVFDSVEDFNNGETELSESSVGLKVQSEFGKRTENAYLVWAGCLQFGFLAPVVAFILRFLFYFFIIVTFDGVVSGALHHFLQLDLR